MSSTQNSVFLLHTVTMMEGWAAKCAMLITKSNFLFARVSQSSVSSGGGRAILFCATCLQARQWQKLTPPPRRAAAGCSRAEACRKISLAAEATVGPSKSRASLGEKLHVIEMYGSKKQQSFFEDTTRTASTVVVSR